MGIDDQLQEYLHPSVVEEQFESQVIEEAETKFDSWLNILVLLLLPFQTFITQLLFKNRDNNYAEHLIMNSFMVAHLLLITWFTHFLFYWFPSLFSIYLLFNFGIGLVYNSYVFKRLFGQRLLTTVLKALPSGTLNLVVFFGLITLASSIALFVS